MNQCLRLYTDIIEGEVPSLGNRIEINGLDINKHIEIGEHSEHTP